MKQEYKILNYVYERFIFCVHTCNINKKKLFQTKKTFMKTHKKYAR